MTSFILIGNGYPAAHVLQSILKMDGARVVGLLTSEHQGLPALLSVAQGIPIRSELDDFQDWDAEWLLSVNTTTKFLPKTVNHFRGRALNLHPGILPAYAGVHVEQWAIRNGEISFGATIHAIEEKLDSGAIVAQELFPISKTDTALMVLNRALRIGHQLMISTVEDLCRGSHPTFTPQDISLRRLYTKAQARDGWIVWTDSADKIHAFIRSKNYEPFTCPTGSAMAHTSHGNFEILRARIGPRTDHMPGFVLDTAPEYALVAAGDGQSVMISRKRNPFDGDTLPSADWTSLKGDVLLSPPPLDV